MSETQQREFLSHPSFGKLPARKVLECIFALSPDGPILHCHLEEVDTSKQGGDIMYSMTGQAPAPGRERCRIIPPLVREFDSLE